ncbi:Transposase domain protein [Verrucomicrobiia bacterium DG1235]|nr:Transposase domain protein [Verrucomicrobiae bacterium DG1235]EDY84663.1 Transposase domain protein [Verrucomicrobiae bacterium DG1235]
MIELNNPFCNQSSHAAYASVDWGHQTNCIHFLPAGSRSEQRFEVAADPGSMNAFMAGLRERVGQGRVAILSEQSKGALVNLLLDFEFVDLFAVNPLAAARFRKSLHPSGAKSDPIDSSALLRMLFTHRDRIKPVLKGDEASRRLDALNAHRRELVEQRVAVALRLKSLLREYYPQALPMVGDELWDPISLAFLRRWPCYSKLSKSKDQTLERFYYANGSRSAKAIAKRVAALRSSSKLSSDPLLEELGALRLGNCVEQLSVLNSQIRAIAKCVKSCFGSHPEKDLFATLPGAGAAMAPRLAAAFGSDRERFEDVSKFQVYVGIAPIKVSSGTKNYTFMRGRCHKFLRQSFHEWAGLTIQFSPWAKACYELMRQRGKRVGVAKRALAFKWTRILYRCWKDRTQYDEAAYVRSLAKRGSPIIGKMKELGFIDDENNLLFT